MSRLDMSDKEREEILKKHKTATKEVREKQETTKKGPLVPEKKKSEEKKG